VIRTEETYLAEIGVLPDDAQVIAGYTAADMRAILRRPASDPAGSRFIPSITYSSAAGEIGQMALYARADVTERAPIVLYAHGGGYHLGHHYNAIRYLHPLAARGYVAATMTYRLEQEAPWPAPIEDAKCAVRWLRHHAAEIGGDPDRIIFAGDSAGAQLAAMTALTPGRAEGDGGWHDVSSEVQGLVLLYPPVDMASTAACGMAQGSDRRLLDYFGDQLDCVSPINNVHAGCPPVLTLTGTADVLTPVEDIRRFHDALEAVGVRNHLEVFPDAPHCFDWHPDHYARCRDLMLAFVDETVGLPLTPRGLL
jgi:acetyl esterase/lipase